MASDQGTVGLAEFTAALSLAADQAAGLSLGHGLRTCLLATRLARRAGLAAADVTHARAPAAWGVHPMPAGARTAYRQVAVATWKGEPR